MQAYLRQHRRRQVVLASSLLLIVGRCGSRGGELVGRAHRGVVIAAP